jgi:hypothetical protein
MKRLLVILALLSAFAIVAVTYAQGPGMKGQGITGANIFNANCRSCHVNGGNIINPGFPMRGSLKLADFKTFLAFIRDPRMPDGSKGPMPPFSKSQISNRQAKELYQYITSPGGLDLKSGYQRGGYNPYCGTGPCGGWTMGPGMRGGYGMGPGMMGPGYGYGGYGMGPGMMGPGYGYGGYGPRRAYSDSKECQKFLDDTAKLRKELHDKRFEYSEAIRNPKTSPETITGLEKEIRQLQENIYSKAPQGCW